MAIRIGAKMIYLGNDDRRIRDGKPAEKPSMIAKFMDGDDMIYNFYTNDVETFKKIESLNKFHPYTVHMDLTSYQGQNNIRFVDIQEVQKK